MRPPSFFLYLLTCAGSAYPPIHTLPHTALPAATLDFIPSHSDQRLLPFHRPQQSSTEETYLPTYTIITTRLTTDYYCAQKRVRQERSRFWLQNPRKPTFTIPTCAVKLPRHKDNKARKAVWPKSEAGPSKQNLEEILIQNTFNILSVSKHLPMQHFVLGFGQF